MDDPYWSDEQLSWRLRSGWVDNQLRWGNNPHPWVCVRQSNLNYWNLNEGYGAGFLVLYDIRIGMPRVIRREFTCGACGETFTRQKLIVQNPYITPDDVISLCDHCWDKVQGKIVHTDYGGNPI